MITKRKSADKFSLSRHFAGASKTMATYTHSRKISQAPCNTCGNSSEAQRQKLMDHIPRYWFIDTVEARRDFDMLHPAGRVLELRKAGVTIQTIRVNAVTASYKIHYVGRLCWPSKGGAI
ncbi:MAG: helix-turn-helix domain-containing protein [Proteobacteria bacterium]|nr:helix-turn-helix domain-containing protein [Pseudomonadota bacterium]MBU0966925.1 helix-turn-helix domain-containing protein [Pseudomonadota bacterium]